MASVGVFSFPSALAGGSATGGGSQVPAPLSPVATSISSSPETSPSPPPSAVASPPTPPPPASPTPEMSPPLVVRPPTPPMSGPAGLFADAFKLVADSSMPFDELDSNASVGGGRGGPGSVGAPESVNGGGSSAGGYPLDVGGSLSDCMEQDCSLCQ